MDEYSIERDNVKDFRAMEQVCQRALVQIRDRRYQEYLLNDGRSDILLYGIAFCRKRCRVMEEPA